MMRGVRPLVGLAVLAWAAGAQAQEMVEVPTPPAYRAPPGCCVAVEEPKPRAPGDVLFAVSVGPTYRRAFREDFAAAAIEVAIGGQSPRFGVAGRLRVDLGATRVGLPYQVVSMGPEFWFRASGRVRAGFGLSFGTFSYQRATVVGADDNVWAPTIGADVAVTVDLVKSARGGALFALARAGYDWIENFGNDEPLATGSSFGLTVALGYRY